VDRKVAVLETRVDWMHEAVTSIRDSTREIAESTKQIALLERESVESRQALSRAFEAMKSETEERKAESASLRKEVWECAGGLEDRIKNMELEMPLLKLAKSVAFSLLGLVFLQLASEVWDKVVLK
jgi:hypothetical protein